MEELILTLILIGVQKEIRPEILALPPVSIGSRWNGQGFEYEDEEPLLVTDEQETTMNTYTTPIIDTKPAPKTFNSWTPTMVKDLDTPTGLYMPKRPANQYELVKRLRDFHQSPVTTEMLEHELNDARQKMGDVRLENPRQLRDAADLVIKLEALADMVKLLGH